MQPDDGRQQPAVNRIDQSTKLRDPNQRYGLASGENSTDKFNSHRPKRKTQVVIVGAGLAGLASAQRLYELGVRDVVILDALERVGGRVHTINHNDYLLEIGAQWLHGAYHNPLFRWLMDMNMLDDFQDASWGFQGLFCTDNNESVDRKLVEKVLCILNEAKTSLTNGEYTNLINQHERASDIFRFRLERSIESDEQLKSNETLVWSLFEWFLRYETIENSCGSMDEVSIQSYTEWADCGEGTLMNFKHGYRSILQWFCSHFPSKRWIHLKKQVVNIELLSQDERENQSRMPILVRYIDTSSNDSGTASSSSDGENRQSARGDCADDAAEGSFIECQHVLVTTSLGFLKKHHKKLFTPNLPDYKQELISSVGFGTVNKIILQFDRPFWKVDGIKLVWSSNDCELSTQFPRWTRDIISFDVVRRQPNLLIGWIGGQGARLVEEESDQNIGDVCIRLLATFLPPSHEKPTRLMSCFCSRWFSNPFTCGSYSFRSVGSSDLDVERLAEPIYDSIDKDFNNNNNNINNNTDELDAKLNSNETNSHEQTRAKVPRIMFAGEATAGDLYSTAHGAVITGWREADRIARHVGERTKKSELALPSGVGIQTKSVLGNIVTSAS